MNEKKIDTLVEDIYEVLDKGADATDIIDSELSILKDTLIHRLSKEAREETPRLRMSNIGTNCKRKLWYSINQPDKAESLPPYTRMKFLYGDVIEWLVLLLAKLSGHRVEGQQTELDINGIKGHRDAVIDGTLTDIKSASKFGFKKFKEHKVKEDDPFGYMDQLGSYRYASDDVTDNSVAFLAVDKDQGHLCLDKYEAPDRDYDNIVKDLQSTVSSSEVPPRAFKPVPMGASGNMKLNIECSYCSFKNHCYPGLRTFVYSSGPVFLTHVERTPDVLEVTNV